LFVVLGETQSHVVLILFWELFVELGEHLLAEGFERVDLALDLLVLLERLDQTILGVEQRILSVVNVVEHADGHLNILELLLHDVQALEAIGERGELLVERVL